MKAKYRVHRLDIKMTREESKLEQFLNSLEGEVVAIIRAFCRSSLPAEWEPKYAFSGLLRS